MKSKSILALTLVAMLGMGALISGCGTNTTNDGNTASDKLQESVDKAGDAVKDGAESVKEGVEGVGDAVKYTAVDVKNDIVKAGHDIKDSLDTKKDYFEGTETDYMLDGNLLRVYEYDNTTDLDKEISKISSDGLSIDGTTIYTTKPHYYKKGHSLIVYEGNDSAYVTELDNLYGNQLV